MYPISRWLWSTSKSAMPSVWAFSQLLITVVSTRFWSSYSKWPLSFKSGLMVTIPFLWSSNRPLVAVDRRHQHLLCFQCWANRWSAPFCASCRSWNKIWSIICQVWWPRPLCTCRHRFTAISFKSFVTTCYLLQWASSIDILVISHSSKGKRILSIDMISTHFNFANKVDRYSNEL